MEHKGYARLPEVLAFTGVKKTTIYDWVNRGKFPKPVPLGDRSVGWKRSDLDIWAVERDQLRLAS